jgi:hypothetical protein
MRLGDKRYFKDASAIAIILGILSWVLGPLVAYLTMQPDLVPLSLYVGIVFITFGGVYLLMNSSFMTAPTRHMQPSDPLQDKIVRVLVEEASDDELFIYGDKDETLREYLKDDWPLDEDLKDKNWYCLDSNDVDVTDKLFSEFEGTVRIYFSDN